MLAKEWWEVRWKFAIAALAVLAFVAFALRPYPKIQEQAEFQIESTRAELESPEEFMPPEEALPPGYSQANYEASLRDQLERMQRPGFPAELARFEMSDLQAGASFVILVPLAAILGVALVSGEVGRGSIFLLLSKPISRTRILLTKYSVGAAVMLAVALLAGGGIVASAYARGYPAATINAAKVLSTAGLFWLGTLSVLGVATLASVIFRDVIRSVVATAVALYAISSLPDWLRGIASYWKSPSEPVSFEDQMAEQAWQQSFEAFRLVNYWAVQESSGGPFMVQYPGPAFSVLVCLIAAVLPLLAALWLFRRRHY